MHDDKRETKKNFKFEIKIQQRDTNKILTLEN